MVEHPRDYPIFRPRAGECDPGLIGLQTLSSEDLDNVRVAKYQGRVIGAYRIERLNSLVYKIGQIGVDVPYRGNGLGSWLLAHAIGIIESKGGREVVVNSELRSLFSRIGFAEKSATELVLTLKPE